MTVSFCGAQVHQPQDGGVADPWSILKILGGEDQGIGQPVGHQHLAVAVGDDAPGGLHRLSWRRCWPADLARLSVRRGGSGYCTAPRRRSAGTVPKISTSGQQPRIRTSIGFQMHSPFRARTRSSGSGCRTLAEAADTPAASAAPSRSQLPPRQRRERRRRSTPCRKVISTVCSSVRDAPAPAAAHEHGAQKPWLMKQLGDQQPAASAASQKRQGIEARDDPRHGQVAQQAQDASRTRPRSRGPLQHGHDRQPSPAAETGAPPSSGDAVQHQALHQHQQQQHPRRKTAICRTYPVGSWIVHGRSSQSTMVEVGDDEHLRPAGSISVLGVHARRSGSGRCHRCGSPPRSR